MQPPARSDSIAPTNNAFVFCRSPFDFAQGVLSLRQRGGSPRFRAGERVSQRRSIFDFQVEAPAFERGKRE